MLTPVRTSRFKKDVKLVKKRGKDIEKLKVVMSILIRQDRLPAAYRDHPLRGPWKNYREVHIEPDWLLIYRVNGDELNLVRTGSHSDLFEE